MPEGFQYRFVMCPNYVRKDPNSSETEAISCKICGTVIAEKMERTIGYETDRAGNRIRVVARQFVYLPTYTEIKIVFEDGSDHVTNGCSNCMHDQLKPEVLDEIHRADQEQSPDGYTERERNRHSVGVIGVVKGGGGIV